MPKQKQTKLVKGDSSSKKLNLQFARAKKCKEDLATWKTGSPSSKTAPAEQKLPKVRRDTSAHKSKHLNEWTPAQMEAACKEYWDSRQPGYPGGPVSDPVFMQQFFVYL